MAKQPYPLESLRKLRDERAEAQAQSLAQQVARSQAAEARVRERERARRQQAERARGTLESEHERLMSGGSSGADLLRVTEFQAAACAEARRLEHAESEARQLLAKERAQEQALREELSRREAEAKLVRNHAARFREHQDAAALGAEEEAALEQWNARRH